MWLNVYTHYCSNNAWCYFTAYLKKLMEEGRWVQKATGNDEVSKQESVTVTTRYANCSWDRIRLIYRRFHCLSSLNAQANSERGQFMWWWQEDTVYKDENVLSMKFVNFCFSLTTLQQTIGRGTSGCLHHGSRDQYRCLSTGGARNHFGEREKCRGRAIFGNSRNKHVGQNSVLYL